MDQDAIRVSENESNDKIPLPGMGDHAWVVRRLLEDNQAIKWTSESAEVAKILQKITFPNDLCFHKNKMLMLSLRNLLSEEVAG